VALVYIWGFVAMRCPFCDHDDSRVIDSRDINDAVRRRRECRECGARFTTYERPERPVLLVVKKDGRREDFKRGKLLSGIMKACAKRPVPQETVEQLVDAVEAELHELGKGEVDSADIGDLVMERLRHLDGVAYIRFASVYRDFADIEDVKQEADAYTRLNVSLNDTAQLPLFAPEELEDKTRRAGGGEPGKRRGEESERRRRVRAPTA